LHRLCGDSDADAIKVGDNRQEKEPDEYPVAIGHKSGIISHQELETFILRID
jgi:hypothetical protein